MRTKTTLAAVLVLPLLLMACDRADNSPTAAAPDQSQEKQATSPDKMLERSPPAAGMPAAPTPAEGQAANEKSIPPIESQEASKKAN